MPLLIAITTVFGFVSHAQAEGPAVSTLNASGSGVIGYNGDIFGSIGGSIRAPISHSYGISVGAGAGASAGDGDDDDNLDDRAFGVGVSGFWRDPEVGSIGVGVGRSDARGVINNSVSAGGSYYSQKWTLSAGGGRQWGDSATWSGGVGLGIYINDNLLIAGGVGGDDDGNIGGVGSIVWQPNQIEQFPNFSLFASANTDVILGGFTLYFGTGYKSLKRRHRED